LSPSPSKERGRYKKEGLTPLLDTLIKGGNGIIKGLKGAKPLLDFLAICASGTLIKRRVLERR